MTLGVWYDGFAGRPELKTEELKPLRRDLLQAALEEFQSVNRELGSNPRLQSARILAMIRVSQVQSDLGQTDASVASVRTAIDAADDFLREDPESIERRDLMVKALHWSAAVETDNSRVAANMERADALIDSLIRDDAARAPGYRQLQLLNANNLALRIRDDQNPDEALRLYQRARDLGEDLARQPGVNSLTLRGLGRTYSYIAETEERRKHPEAAETALRRSNELFRKVFEREPHEIEFLMEHCLSCEQMQNFLGRIHRLDEATRFAQEVCRVLSDTARDTGWRDSERLQIRLRLLRANYMVEQQYGEKQQAFENEPKRYEMELRQFEAACRQTHELAESLRPIVSGNRDLDYFDCISCINIYFIMNDHFKNAREAREWLVRAYTSLPQGIEREPDPRRREHYARIKEIHDREIPGGGQPRATSANSSARPGNP
jgi:tetratricopeptide (TPR) repeat protein